MPNKLQLNSYSMGEQEKPFVEGFGDKFIVTWASFGQVNPASYDLIARNFNLEGSPLTDEYQVSTTAQGAGTYGSAILSMGSSKTAIVYGEANVVAGKTGILINLFNSTGAPLATPSVVDDLGTVRIFPTAVNLTSVNYFVAWQTNFITNIYGILIDSNGANVGFQTRLNTYSTDEQIHPDLAAFHTGGFITTWQSLNQDSNGWGVIAQRYTNSIAKVGPEFIVNTYTTGNQIQPAVAVFSDDSFVITWGSDGGQDGDLFGIFAQRFAANGTSIGSEFQVNTFTNHQQMNPDVAVLTSDDFIITWQSDLQDGDGFGIYAQRFNNTGSPANPEFRLNAYTLNDQLFPSIASLPNEHYVVVWQSIAQDGSGAGIFGHIGGPLELITNVLTINEGDSLTLSSNEINLTDSNHSPSEINIIIGDSEHVQFVNSGNPVTIFTYQNLLDTQIKLIHDGSELPPNYYLNVTDGSVTLTYEYPIVSFTNVNDRPTLVGSIPDHEIDAETSFSFKLDPSIFYDPDDSFLDITVSTPTGSSLPNWLTYSAADTQLSGKAPNEALSIPLKVTATDAQGASENTRFNLNIEAVESNQVRNALLSSLIPGVFGISLFVSKQYFNRRAKNELQKSLAALKSSNDDENQSFMRTVVYPVAKATLPNLTTSGFFTPASEKIYNDYIAAIYSIMLKVNEKGMDYTQLSIAAKDVLHNMLFDEINKRASKRLLSRPSLLFYPPVTHTVMKKNAGAIADYIYDAVEPLRRGQLSLMPTLRKAKTQRQISQQQIIQFNKSIKVVEQRIKNLENNNTLCDLPSSSDSNGMLPTPFKVSFAT